MTARPDGIVDERDLEELQAYLGERFDMDTLRNHQRLVDAEAERAADEATFYRTSELYLYDLTVFAMSGTKTPYLADLRRLVPRAARLLDYGCGIGADGLRLTEAGYDVTFADFDNPSTRYLRWRLAHRGWAAPVVDVDAEADADWGHFDAAYSFDVIEHVDDPMAFLLGLERRANLVVVNLLDPDPDDTHLHRPLAVGELIDYAERRGLVHYRRYHQRSHLIAYRSGPARAVDRVRARAARLAGVIAGRAEDRRAARRLPPRGDVRTVGTAP